MTIEIIKGNDIYNRLSSISRYPNPKKDKFRLFPIAQINSKIKFEINKNEKFFTIGSCFARNIQKTLIKLGLNVIDAEIDTLKGSDNIVNKYTPCSIRQDLELILTNAKNDISIYEDLDGYFYNLSFGGVSSLKKDQLDSVRHKTNLFYKNLKKIVEADVVIITLGLIETWFDIKRSFYLNIAPTKSIIKKNPNTFELHVLDYVNVLENLQKIVSHVKSLCKKNVKIIFTVSPVPLHATFRDQDCIQANIYSKAVLRSAVEEIFNKDKNIAYFPSFETVIMTSGERVWIKEDYRHVNQVLVDSIMLKFIKDYIPSLAVSKIKPSKYKLQQNVLNKKFNSVISEVDNYCSINKIRIIDTDVFIKYYYAVAKLNEGEISCARDLLINIIKQMPKHINAESLLKKINK
jgi:hypothetical protein